MLRSLIRARLLPLAALGLIVVGLVGCSPDFGQPAPLPPSTELPPPPPKEVIGADGKPKHSTAAFDTAHGAQPPK
jgi:hypothetical protein